MSLVPPAAHIVFHLEVTHLEAVQECYQVTGDADHILKLRCSSLANLANLVSNVLPRLTGVSRVRSTVILTTVKESSVLPLPPPETNL